MDDHALIIKHVQLCFVFVVSVVLVLFIMLPYGVLDSIGVVPSISI